jgi:hypothetical protein
MTNIVELQIDKQFKREQELYSRIISLIHEYDGELSVVSVLGILELSKDHVKAASV